jgi:hypothetical protein
MKLRQKGSKLAYEFLDLGCLGRTCFQPGLFQHRGATLSGSRNTGSPDTACCMCRAYHGCPSGPVGQVQEACDCPPNADGNRPHPCHVKVGLPLVDPELTKKRKEEGWRKA